jgi:hypothetical protein
MLCFPATRLTLTSISALLLLLPLPLPPPCGSSSADLADVLAHITYHFVASLASRRKSGGRGKRPSRF